jgi:hypothetical protein
MNRTLTHLHLQAINCYYTKNYGLVLSIVFSIGVIIFNYTKYSLVLVAPARAYAGDGLSWSSVSELEIRAYACAMGGEA